MEPSRTELIIGIISGAIFYPAGLAFIYFYIDNVYLAHSIGVLTSLCVHLAACKTFYAWALKRHKAEYMEQIDWLVKHQESSICRLQRKHEERIRALKDPDTLPDGEPIA